ncbi:MAG: hypothetical protein NTX75_02165 [Proteobacteria bacterium]|nr:hypothetical protein [Pseudomonadota bacterium]
MDVLSFVEKALNVRAFNHKVLAGNITHVETPNYKEKEVDFKQALERQMAGLKNIEIQEKTESDGMGSVDGNTVNMEVQMVKMNENSMMYNALIQIISKKFSMMRYMISEGRR